MPSPLQTRRNVAAGWWRELCQGVAYSQPAAGLSINSISSIPRGASWSHQAFQKGGRSLRATHSRFCTRNPTFHFEKFWPRSFGRSMETTMQDN